MMIAHLDGDAFFASVYQAIHPETKGKPVVIGRERGIATAFSYEAKTKGVTRGMLISEVKRICPESHIVTSDYRLYEMFCRRIIAIASEYTPTIERYSIDEIFLELDDPKKGLKIKKDIERALNITVSVGISLTKCLAKVASDYDKPSGYVVIRRHNIPSFLNKVSVDKIWGIGPRLSIRMRALKIYTGLDLIRKPQSIIAAHFNKSVLEIWHELQGHQQYLLNTENKTTYQSIQNTHTYTPATNNYKVLYSRMSYHIEKAFIKARAFHYQVGSIHMFLKTQKFSFRSTSIQLPQKISYPFLIRNLIEEGFNRIYSSNTLFRAVGCTLSNLEKKTNVQQELFPLHIHTEERLKDIYTLVDQRKIRFASELYDKERKQTMLLGLPEFKARI